MELSKKYQINKVVLISSTAVLSRILGLFRDMLTAWVLGANADSLSLALRIPHFFRRLLADGALSQSRTSQLVQNSALPKVRLFEYGRLVWFGLGFWLVLLLFANYLMDFLAPGISAESLEQSVLYFRLASPYCLLALLASRYMARLNSKNNFTASSFSPIIFNLSFLASLALLNFFFPKNSFAIIASLSMTLAGLTQVINLALASHKNIKFDDKNISSVELKSSSNSVQLENSEKNKKSELSNIIFASSLQLSFLVSAFLASFLDSGRMSALFYAEKVIELPLGVLSLALALISVVKFNELVKKQDFSTLAQELSKNIAINLWLALPAFFGLLALSEEIVQILFMHGNFDAQIAYHTVQALEAYAPCLLINALLLPLLIASRALNKQKIYYVLLGLALNLGLGLILINYDLNPAWSSSFGLFVILVLVYYNLSAKIKISFSKKELTKQFILSIFIYCLSSLLTIYLNAYLALLLALILSIVFYLALSRDFILRVFPLTANKRSFNIKD